MTQTLMSKQQELGKAMAMSHSRPVLHPYGRGYLYKGKTVRRVTSITKMDGSSGERLIPWAANVERIGILKVLQSLVKPNMEPIVMLSAESWLDITETNLPKKKFHAQIFEEAGELGTLGHSIIEFYVKRKKDIPEFVWDGEKPDQTVRDYFSDAPDDLWRGVWRWLQWAKEVDLQPLAIETTMIHDEGDDPDYWYAGTFDCLAYVNGKVCVCDWKTSSGIYNNYYYQIAAYRHAIEMDTENNWPKPEGSVVVLVPKKKGITFKAVSIMDRVEHEADLDTFMALQTLAIRTDQLRKRK